MRRLAILSMHTSPLAQPGTGDGGGMNVYVREMAAALARSGARCDVFTRSWSPDLAATVKVEPGFYVHHIAAGPQGALAKELLPSVVDEFTQRVLDYMRAPADGPTRDDSDAPFEAVHANYWLSGLSGHVIKHELDIPLVSTFHTLDRVKATADPEEIEADIASARARAEAQVIACSDAVLASCSVEAEQIEELYGADPQRIRIVAPGVDHAVFGPGYRPKARRAIAIAEGDPVLVFVGRIQPLKQAEVALGALSELRRRGRGGHLVVVGGPSGPRGEQTYRQLRAQCHELGLDEHVTFVDPQPHELLSSYYRAGDVCIVPSKSESFGFVALEAAACGTPVVAAAVGGLTSLIDHGRTGFLVEDPSPGEVAGWIEKLLDDSLLAERMATSAVIAAREYTWKRAALSLHAIYDELQACRLVECR